MVVGEGFVIVSRDRGAEWVVGVVGQAVGAEGGGSAPDRKLGTKVGGGHSCPLAKQSSRYWETRW